MNYHPFVLPFAIGLYGLILFLIFRYTSWILSLPKEDKIKLTKTLASYRLVLILKDIILEVLLHRRIFKKNPLLGYMHMSLAFGWFLLILGGTVESKIYSAHAFNEPWVPIFFKYFHHNPEALNNGVIFNNIMDALLLFVLSGVFLALFKRVRSRFFGMKSTTKQSLFDTFALGALWLIFPLRLLAESTTSALYDNGGFLTGTVGNALATVFPLHALQNAEINLWWAYSIALFTFFILLPLTRYMHIPTEMFHIALRTAGISPRKSSDGASKIQVNSCSRCGVCIDSCQLGQQLNRKQMLPVYYLQGERKEQTTALETNDCMMCGRCTISCPVGLDINTIRLNRRSLISDKKDANYSYLPEQVPAAQSDVLYFAGCMTHLTPSIKKSMTNLLNAAGVNWTFLDKDGTICCGRPVKLSGKKDDATKLMNWNVEKIMSFNPKMLVTSCPICFKTFTEDYNLPIPVLHHSQYLKQLIKQGKLKLRKTGETYSYHDPCELGRLSGIYEDPRYVIRTAGGLVNSDETKENALCCGSSLAHFHGSDDDRIKLAQSAFQSLTSRHPDKLVTSCPLCYKAFARVSDIPVKDLSEILESALVKEA